MSIIDSTMVYLYGAGPIQSPLFSLMWRHLMCQFVVLIPSQCTGRVGEFLHSSRVQMILD